MITLDTDKEECDVLFVKRCVRCISAFISLPEGMYLLHICDALKCSRSGGGVDAVLDGLGDG